MYTHISWGCQEGEDETAGAENQVEQDNERTVELRVERLRRRELVRRRQEGGGEGFTGLIVDISALLVGFFTSLVPRTPPVEANGF